MSTGIHMRASSSVLLSGITCLTLLSCQDVPGDAKQPNIVIIVTDDQGYSDLSAFDHAATDIQTPNMDRVAREGILFTQGYVTAPVCSPSRAGWNTGRYQERWGHWSWGKELPASEMTLAEYLGKAGYSTGKFGKSDFGTNYHRMDVREYPLNYGYDEFLGFSSHAHDYFLLSDEVALKTPDPHGHSAALGPLFHNRSRKGFQSGYTTEIFTDYAIDFIDRHRESPFFLTVTYNSVHHLIHEVPDRYLQKFGAEKIPDYDPAEGGNYKDYYDKYAGPDEVGPEYRKWYLANLACLDDNIGRLLDALDEMDLTGDTLLILFSDNGGSPLTGALNAPLSGSKYNLLEGGIRVPFMMRFPGRFPAGISYHHVISTLDLVPTVLEAAGLELPPGKKLDGVGLYQELIKPTPQGVARGPLFWHFQDQFAVRDGDWKLVRTDKRGDEIHLYNLREDLAENLDLATEENDQYKRLLELYENWKAEMAPMTE